MANNIVAQMQVLISAQTKGLNTALSQSQSALSSFQSAIGKTNQLLTSFGVGFGLFQVTRALSDGVDILKDFELQMDTVRAITGATGAEFKALEDDALRLGKSTKFTATQVAELQTEYGRLGFTTSEILAATEATLKLSIATGEDLAKSADVAGSTVRGFGLNASETGRVVDVMAEAFNKSALALDNFSEAMKFVAPIAKAAGATVEETTALLGTLADAGLRGSNAGTALRKIFSDLSKDGRPLAVRLKELADKGITLSDAYDEVGRTAQTALLVLTNNVDKTDALTVSLNNAAGAAQKAADIMGDNLSGDLDKLSSAYEGLILSENGATGALRSVTQAATDFLSSLSEQDSSFGKFLDSFGELISIIPRGAAALANFFNDEGLSADELGKKLENLKRHRDAAIASGNRAAEISLTKEIINLTNAYGLLTPSVEASNVPMAKSAEEIGKIATAVTPALGIIAQLEAQIKDLEEKKKAAFSVGEIQNFNSQIDELKFKLVEVNSELSAFGKSVINAPAIGIGITGTEFEMPKLEVENIFPTTIPVPDIAPAMAALEEYTAAVQRHGVANIQSTEQQILAHEQLIESEQRRAEMAIRVGNIIGDSVGDVLSGQKTLVQGVKQATAELLKVLLARALGGIISGAATTGAPPPVAIALATAGVAAISALFKAATGVGKSVSGGGSGPSLTNVNRLSPVAAQESIHVEGEFVLHGNDAVAQATSEQNRLLRLGR